jgi:hypothetical protein|tara:strand:- start:522 stop:680 length:159 start_codon:yes stop_codon:yes gene_type:complete
MYKKIVSTVIKAEWNDNPKMEILFHEMPSDLQNAFDEWLTNIEKEENAKNGN